MAIRRVNQDGLWERKCRKCGLFKPELTAYHLFKAEKKDSTPGQKKRVGTPSSNLCKECYPISKKSRTNKAKPGNRRWKVSPVTKASAYQAVCDGYFTSKAVASKCQFHEITASQTLKQLFIEGMLSREKGRPGGIRREVFVYAIKEEATHSYMQDVAKELVATHNEREEEMADPRLRIMSDPEGLIREIVAQEVASRDELVAGLEKQIHDFEGRIIRMSSVSSQVDNLFADNSGLADRVAALEAKLEGIDDRLSSHGKMLARMNGADANGRDAKIAELEKDVAVVRNLRQIFGESA